MFIIQKITQAFQITITFIILILSSTVNAQTEDVYQIDFQGDLIDMTINIDNFQWNQFPQSSILNNRYTGWMHFSQTPTLAIQEDLRAAGIELNSYLPHHTYAFTALNGIPITLLKQKGIISIIPYSNAMKMSFDLKNETIGDWAIQGDKTLINVEHFDLINRDSFMQHLKNDNIEIVEAYTTGNLAVVAVENTRLPELASFNYIRYLEVIPPPSVKEDTDGRGLHRASNLDTQRVGGRNYTGEGIGVLVRDDGIVGPHIDFEGRIDNTLANGSGQTHGDGVAGILAGAGNLNPENRGMAAGSNVFVSNYASSFLDGATTTFIGNGSVQITNSSYGNGCNGGYTTIANRVDAQTNTTPSLLHVFSAGNSNGADCGYGAGGQWGNITGGHKQGKNVIATANVFDDGTIASSSSKGPATDGRIKPDITAHGQGHISTDENNGYRAFGGTSGASPGIAGVAAQLYEAYVSLGGTFSTLPESALIKAIMLNTANDAGNVGPDFQFGWGIVNGLRAVKTLEDGRFFNQTISQGNNQNTAITIPANTSQLKIMLYWSDPAATPGATTALVNDLDLTVTDPTGTISNPWILNSTPNVSALSQPATTGVDRLNNMEQVLINNPTAGNYTINVTGFNVPMGAQKYYIVYDVIEEPLTITYPDGGESLTPGSTEYIQWDAVNTSGNFTLEYSTDNGTSWNNITTTSSNASLYEWTIPNDISGSCLVRITDGNGANDQSDVEFSIANRVSGISITQVCPTYINVTWNQVLGASSYDIYTLGQKFMELNGSSNTLSYSIPITNINDVQWIAVSANGGNGWKSLRSNAIEYDGGGLLNCDLNNDLTISSILNSPLDFVTICSPGPITVSASVENLGLQDQSNFTISYQVNNNAVVQETYNNTLVAGGSIIYNFNTPLNIITNGPETLRVWTTITGDEQLINNEKELDYFAATTSNPLDISENFEVNGFLPQSWSLDNPDGATTWVERLDVIGSNGNLTTAAYLEGATYVSRGQVDSFTTNYYDLNLNGNAVLTFDLAKAQWSASFNDELRIEISTDCGNSFTEIYFKDGLTLATVPYTTGTWSPSSASDWRQESIDLGSYIGNDILLRFINVNDYSNSTFIDNIALNSTLSNRDNVLSNAVRLFPNPATNIAYLTIDQELQQDVDIQIMNNLGQIIQSISKVDAGENISIDIAGYSTGLYFVNLKSGSLQTTKKLIIK